MTFDFSLGAVTEIGQFFKRSGKVIAPLTAAEILEDRIAMKLAQGWRFRVGNPRKKKDRRAATRRLSDL